MDASSSPPPDGLAPDPKPPKLLERMRIHLRTRHDSIRTEQAYLDWARRFILYHTSAIRKRWVHGKWRHS